MGIEAEFRPPIGPQMPILSQPNALSAHNPTWQQLPGAESPLALQTQDEVDFLQTQDGVVTQTTVLS